MGEGVNALPQGGQIVPVAGRRVPFQIQGLQKADVALQGDELLGQLSPVEGGPELQVDFMVEPVNLRRVGDAVGPAHVLKGPGGGLGEVEQGVVGVEKQVLVSHHRPVLSAGFTAFIVARPPEKDNHPFLLPAIPWSEGEC